jgi:hypothetical protein
MRPRSRCFSTASTSRTSSAPSSGHPPAEQRGSTPIARHDPHFVCSSRTITTAHGATSQSRWSDAAARSARRGGGRCRRTVVPPALRLRSMPRSAQVGLRPHPSRLGPQAPKGTRRPQASAVTVSVSGPELQEKRASAGEVAAVSARPGESRGADAAMERRAGPLQPALGREKSSRASGRLLELQRRWSGRISTGSSAR